MALSNPCAWLVHLRSNCITKQYLEATFNHTVPGKDHVVLTGSELLLSMFITVKCAMKLVANKHLHDIVQISLWSCRQKVKSSADGKPMYCHRWSCHNGPVPLFKKQLTRHMCSSGVVVLWVQNLTANLNDGVHRLQARKADGELNLQKKASDASAPGPLMRLDGDGPMPGTSFLSQEAPALVLSFRFLIAGPGAPTTAF